MSTEETPLLGDQTGPHVCPPLPSDDIYNRFTPQRKRVILAIVAISGLIPTLVGGSFVPSIPQISKDLGETPANVSLGVSLSVLASSFGVMFWSGYSSFYGRRWVFLFGLPFTVIGSLAVAASTDLYSMLFWRFIQTFGCSAGFSNGAAIMGDIYVLEERGSAMGTFFAAMLLGFAIAPPVGGVLAQYWSWRGFQASLGAFAVLQILSIALLLPETSHPGTRGIDKEHAPKSWFVWINPFRCLAFLRSPNVLAVALSSTTGLLTDFALLVPIAYTLGAKYGITSESIIGFLFIPNGIGNFLSAPIAGRVSDMAVRQAKAKRNGVWVPEDRLRGMWLGGFVLIPVSVTLAGFTMEYISGTIGLVINLVCLFTNGFGVNMVLTPTGTYVVDVMPTRSPEVMAAIAALRAFLIACASALILPAIETIGAAATYGITGVLALIGQCLIWLTIRYGKEMRAYVDIGYPDFDARAQ